MSQHDYVVLTCKSVCHYSQIDEDLFFAWIKRIPCVVTFDGRKDELYLYMRDNNISNLELLELLALFRRYHIDMQQLEVFVNEHNRWWFYNES